MLKFPYGISDFYKVRTGGYYYVDRTTLIPAFEAAGEYLLLLRPRRFGKSLWLSVLQHYYDLAQANVFEELFGDLAIGQQPTPSHNQYFMLAWDFSAVSTLGEGADIQQALYDYINETIRAFSKDYYAWLKDDIMINPDNASASFLSLLTAVRQTNYKLYLLIDEYDNFANELMMGSGQTDQTRYQALVYGEGCLKALFKVIKAATRTGDLDRIFITGVSPVVMSDITSGYNITEDIYLLPQFNHLCGFTETEIASVLQDVVGTTDGEDKYEEALTLMRTFYNGYAFTYNQAPSVYNPTLALYFLKHLQTYNEYPRRMLDTNLAMDKNKLAYIAQLPHGPEIIMGSLSQKQGISISELAYHFGVADMLQATKDTSFMVSLLYFFGVLTLTPTRTALGKLILQVPNLVIRDLYLEQLQDMYLPDFESRHTVNEVAETLYQNGNLQPLCDFVETRYFKVFDNRDYRWSNELTLKTIFLTLLFNDTFYLITSETPLEGGYADLVMIVRPDMRQFSLLDFLIEFKYLSLSELGLSGQELKEISHETLKTLPQVQAKLSKAQASLASYRQALINKYGNVLNLRAYVIIGLGFERVVWVEVT